MEEKSSLKSLGIVILSVCLFAVGFATGKLLDVNPIESLRRDRGGFNLDLYWNVKDMMDSRFVGPEDVSDDDILFGTIKGMVDSYGDPATIFLDPEETQMFLDTSQGKYFEGIGAELGYNEGQIVVVAPIEGSPAKESGIMPGDIILQVDDTEIKLNDNIYEVVNMIRGEAGTVVTLKVLHRGEMEPVDIEITRGAITVPSMEVKYLDNGIAHIDVARFTDSDYVSWTRKWDNIIDDVVSKGYEKIILDLRGNPGGFFDAAVYSADDFLDKDKIISYQEDGSGKRVDFKAKSGGRLLGLEIVVLVDQGSASASEILAGALQQNDVASVIGVSTYGKGTAQAVETLPGGSSIHITVLKWLLPDGSWLNRDNPIVPDIEVELTTDDFKKGLDPQLDRAIEELDR